MDHEARQSIAELKARDEAQGMRWIAAYDKWDRLEESVTALATKESMGRLEKSVDGLYSRMWVVAGAIITTLITIVLGLTAYIGAKL